MFYQFFTTGTAVLKQESGSWSTRTLRALDSVLRTLSRRHPQVSGDQNNETSETHVYIRMYHPMYSRNIPVLFFRVRVSYQQEV